MKVESGRSMVEMLGVLAIIGTLSVGGSFAYKKAMNAHKANNLINALQRTAIEVSSIMMAEKNPTLAALKIHSDDTDYLIHTDVRDSEGNPVTIGLGRPSSFGNYPTATDEQFALIMNPVDKEICKEIFLKSHDRSTIQELKLFERSAMESAEECEDGQLVATYNRDLSSDAVLSAMKTQEECTENGFTWCDNKGNGVSGCIRDASSCCDGVDCDTGSVCRLGQCKQCTNTRLDNGTTVCVVPGEDTTDCVGGYGTPYCVHCTADQGMAHCSSYSDSDAYRDYGHTPCVCGDNYACSSHSCINCPEGQKPTCAEYVEWTTQGGGCVCAYSDEEVVCPSYGQCIFCPNGEQRVCGQNEENCICVPKGQTGACSNSYYDCGCGNGSACIVCPEGQKAVCPKDVDNCYWCNSSPACKCVPEDEEFACADYYYGGDPCISCPAGKKPKCYTEGGYYDPPSSKCECLEENEDIVCTSGEYGDLCKKCLPGQELRCPGGAPDSSGCICVDPGTTNVACSTGGDTCGCSSSSGKCVTCDEGETAICTHGVSSCCDGNNTNSDCTCVPSDKQGQCTDSECIVCDKGESVLCTGSGENCICVPSDKQGYCSQNECILCNIDQTPVCSAFGTCSCVDASIPSACNRFSCMSCDTGKEAVCPDLGPCKCISPGETYACNENGCITCTSAQGKAVCPDADVNCICAQEDTPFECGTSACAQCVLHDGTIERTNTPSGTACTIYSQSSGTCDGQGNCVLPNCTGGKYANFPSHNGDNCTTRPTSFSCSTPSVSKREVIQGVEWARSSSYMNWWTAESFCKALGMRLPSRQYICNGSTSASCVSSELRKILYDKFGYVGIHLEDGKDNTRSYRLTLYDGGVSLGCRSNVMWCCQGDYVLCYKPAQ